MTIFENEQGWQLESLRIDFQNYGEFKGRYTAKVTFQNKQTDAFTFMLSPEKTLDYLHLISDQLSDSAGKLGQRLLQSLSLLPPAAETKAIGEAIPHEPV